MPSQSFTGIDLFGELRDRLSRAANHPVGLRELSQMMGRPKSTTHFWLSEYHHPQVLGLMALLERLSPNERQSFIASHCRELPTLADTKLSGTIGELKKLLDQPHGMTLITGSTAAARCFALTAFAHSWSSLSGLAPTGIYLHRPQSWVPVIGVRYIDEKLTATQIRALVTSVWTRILTSGAKLAIFNGPLSVVPEAFDDLLRMASIKHVILAEPFLPDFSTKPCEIPVHVVTVATGTHIDAGIEISCRAGQPSRRK